jgi:glycosyltransferase involved in cell wall biosynthesis
MLLTNAFDPDPRVYSEALALVKNGYNVNILCWDRDRKLPSNEIVEDISIERIFVKSTHGRGISQIFFLPLFWLKALAKVYEKPVNLVHAHDFDTLPLGCAIAKLKGAKLVYDSHESYVDMLFNLPALMRGIIYRMENFFLKRTDLVITVGNTLRAHLKKRGAKHVSVIGNWRDPSDFDFDMQLLRKERKKLGIEENQCVIVFIANLIKERPLPQLIEAVKNLPNTFLILGGGGYYEKIAAEADLQYQNILYLGYVHPSKIPLYTALADVVFYGFDPNNPNAKFSAPNKLFEALAAGKTILTCDFGEIGKIVKDTDCGMLLENYSAEEIARVISKLTPSVMQRLKANSKATGFKYSWPKAVEELIRQYQIF